LWTVFTNRNGEFSHSATNEVLDLLTSQARRAHKTATAS
jgi:hypothetical protein